MGAAESVSLVTAAELAGREAGVGAAEAAEAAETKMVHSHSRQPLELGRRR